MLLLEVLRAFVVLPGLAHPNLENNLLGGLASFALLAVLSPLALAGVLHLSRLLRVGMLLVDVQVVGCLGREDCLCPVCFS